MYTEIKRKAEGEPDENGHVGDDADKSAPAKKVNQNKDTDEEDEKDGPTSAVLNQISVLFFKGTKLLRDLRDIDSSDDSDDSSSSDDEASGSYDEEQVSGSYESSCSSDRQKQKKK